MTSKEKRPVYKERRSTILEAAIKIFATKGYHKVTTADISAEAGISQPYVYRFFETKEALFLEAVELIYQRIANEFKKIEGNRDNLVDDLIIAYEKLMVDFPHEIQLQVQTWGIQDEKVQNLVKKSMVSLKNLVQEKFNNAGLNNADTLAKDFLARGLLCNLAFVFNSTELNYLK